MSKIIGIDLGTTNSCVAIMDGAQPKVYKSKGLTSDEIRQNYNATKSRFGL